MKKAVVLFLCAFLLAVCCIPVGAHSGKTDAAGGHYDSSTGEYHYHHGYPAHQHTNGTCPYNFDDKTNHQDSSSNKGSYINVSKKEDDSITPEDILQVIATIVIIAFVLILVISIFSEFSDKNKSSSSSSSPAPKSASNPPPVEEPKPTEDPAITNLKKEVSDLKRQNKDLQNELASKKSLIHQHEYRIAELEGTDAQKQIQDLNRDLMWTRSDRDTAQAKLRSLTNRHDQYVREKEAELKKAKEAAVPVVAPPVVVRDEAKEKELTEQIRKLNKINDEHEKTISSLKKELATQRSDSASQRSASAEQFVYLNSQIDQLQSQLDDAKAKDVLYIKLDELSRRYAHIFAGYPTLDAFYRQVQDKRFHKALVEDISLGAKINFDCQIVSKGTSYRTSLSGCSCPDFQRRKVPCKHMLFVAYNTGVLLLNKDRMESALKIYLDELRSNPPKK